MIPSMIWSTLKICALTYVDVGDEVCCWQVTFMWWWWQVISKSVTGWSYCWSPTTVSNTHRVHSLRTNWLRRVEIVSLTRVRLTTVVVYIRFLVLLLINHLLLILFWATNIQNYIISTESAVVQWRKAQFATHIICSSQTIQQKPRNNNVNSECTVHDNFYSFNFSF